MRLLLLLSLISSPVFAAPQCNATYGAAGSTSNCASNGGNSSYVPSPMGTEVSPSPPNDKAGTLSPTVPPDTYNTVTKELTLEKVCLENQYCYRVILHLENPDIRYAAYVGLNLSN